MVTAASMRPKAIGIHADFKLGSLLRKLHLKHGNTAIHGG